MTLGVMQPYFLPYMGYFQLMCAVDTFIYYDDVTYIKGGWINRNYILLNDRDHLFTLELKGASSFKKINEIGLGKNRDKLYKTFLQAYSKAPYYKELDWLLYSMFHTNEDNLFDYILYTHNLIFNYLDLDINYLISSKLDKDCSLKGQEKIIHICKKLKADTYLNAIGGKKLYSKEVFRNNGIDLRFIKSSDDLPKRSIIDVLMNYSKKEINMML